MQKINNYYFAKDIQDAYDTLIKSKSNVILGGNMWLRLMDKNINIAIDISRLKLNYIVECDKYISIGAMTTLSDLEHNDILKRYFGTLFSDVTHHIVGTQFRNTATLGGSIFGRYGFSDILTGILPLSAIIKTAKHGEMLLLDFCELPYEKDVVEYIKIPKAIQKISYKSFRNQATDFPVITVCVVKHNKDVKICVGARPQKAKVVHTLNEALNLNYGSNMRASAEYRKELAKILIDEAYLEVIEG